MKIQSIPLDQIDLFSNDWDQFIFTFPTAAGAIKDSIAEIGLQQPVVVAENGESYRIVIGVRRLLACQELAWKKVPAIVHRELSDERLLWLSLREKIGSHEFNAIEKSRVLQKFAEIWQGDLERLQEEICPLLEIPATAEAVENYLFMKEMQEEQQQGVAEGRLTPDHLEPLQSLLPEDRKVAAEKLFGSYRPSVRQIREIVEDAAGLAAREGSRVADIFERPEVKEIYLEDRHTPRQRTSLLRSWLRSERFPRLSALEDEFENLSRQVTAGRPIQIKPPRDFEGDEIAVSFRCETPAGLEQILKTLNDAQKKGLWRRMFSLLHGDSLGDDL